nr:unnamed protein product [Callosobruchus analis]
MTTSATNTDPPCTVSSKESQWSPSGLQKGTQSFTPAAEKSLQTDQKKQAPLTTVTVENAAIPPKCCQVKNLVIQSLPPIDVRIPQRRMQSLLHYSIENNHTNLLFKNDICNVAFQLAKSADFTEDTEPPPVKPEPSGNLLKIMEKGKKARSSVAVETPRVAKRILGLEYPDNNIFTSEDDDDDEEEDEPRDTSEQEADLQSPPPVVLDMSFALRITDTKRSISEVIEETDKGEACLFANELPVDGIPPERENVLRSYHVYDNVNAHDPGMLNSSSLDFVSKVDENIYKTYINPSGFQKPLACDKSNQNISKTGSMRRCGLSKWSTMKVNTQSSGVEPKGSTTQAAIPKIWSLGFYANKSTQVDTPSDPQLERSSQGEVQQEQNPPTEEERALKVTDFTHSASGFQLTNEEEYRPAQLQAEKDEDPAYQPIGCDGRCNQWAADLRTVITSIREPKEELEMEKGRKEEPIQDIQKETKNAGCSCSLLTSKADVHVSQNVLETPRPKQESIFHEIGSQKVSSSAHPSLMEHTNTNSETNQKPNEAEGNEDENKASPSYRIEKSPLASPKQSGRAEDGSQTTLVEYRTMNGSHVETISLTVSYTTGDSVDVNPVLQNIARITPPLQARESSGFSGLSNSQKTKFQLPSQITEEGKVKLRAIKDKLVLEHGEQSKSNLASETVQSIDQIDVCDEVSNFISGLTQRSSGELKKVIPIIRSSVHSRKSLSKQEKLKPNRTFDVNYAIGDIRQPKDEPKLSSKFNEGSGGSLKPKTPPTRQAAHEKPEPQIIRRAAKHSGHHKHKHKNNFKLETPSNSETITTERSKSEGELTSCQCVVSNGELHSCRYDHFHRMKPPMFNDGEDLVTTIRKKRSYFNNCVTYYLKRTPVPGPPYSSNRNSQQQVINNSSLSSNTAT